MWCFTGAGEARLGCCGGAPAAAGTAPGGFSEANLQESGASHPAPRRGRHLLGPPMATMTDIAFPAGRAALRPARDRGALDIADRVVAKIAGRAASEVPGVQVPNAGGLRDLVGSGMPKVQAEVDGVTAAVTIVVAIDYPLPVFDTAAEIRRLVTSRLSELAGLQLVEVRVEVDELTVSARSTGRRVE